VKLTTTKKRVKDIQADIETDRATYIGASDVSAILGLNPFKSPYSVFAEKCDFVPAPDLSDRLAVVLGQLSEETVAQLFTRETGKKVRRSNIRYGLKEFPFFGVHLDRLVKEPDGGTAILECKTTFSRRPWDGYEEGNIPPWYYAQVMAEMAVSGIHRAYIAVLRTGPAFDYWAVPYNAKEAEIILNTCADFWQHVQRREWPEGEDINGAAPTSTRDTIGALRRSLWTEDTARPVQLEDGPLEEIATLSAEIKRLSDEKTRLENQVKEKMKGAQRGTSARHTAKYRTIDTNRLDTAALKKDHPELVEQYTRPTSYDRFSVEERKDDKQ